MLIKIRFKGALELLESWENCPEKCPEKAAKTLAENLWWPAHMRFIPH